VVNNFNCLAKRNEGEQEGLVTPEASPNVIDILKSKGGESAEILGSTMLRRRGKRKLRGKKGEAVLFIVNFNMHIGVWNIRGMNDPLKQKSNKNNNWLERACDAGHCGNKS